jgi:hypothetical protein
MSDDRDAYAERAAKRNGWPVQRFQLGSEPSHEVVGATMNERLAMMWPLALDAWASTGKPLPSYERHNMPGRVIRTRDQELP